jgi:hypothetical protein
MFLAVGQGSPFHRTRMFQILSFSISADQITLVARVK